MEYNEATTREGIRLYVEEELSQREAASRVGMTRSALKYHLELVGVSRSKAEAFRTSPHVSKRLHTARRIMHLRSQGLNDRQIAAEIDLSRTRVNRIRRRVLDETSPQHDLYDPMHCKSEETTHD